MTSPLSRELHKRVLGAIRAVRSEEFHDGRMELYYLAHEHDHLVDILGVMVEEELAPTIREDFLLMAAKQVPWKLRELLDRDQQAAEIALKHRDFRELSGGPEALVGWVMDQPEAIRKNHIELLARSAIEEAMAQPETEPHLLRLLAEQNVLGSVKFARPLLASKHQKIGPLLFLVDMAERRAPGFNHAKRTMEVVALLVDGGANLEERIEGYGEDGSGVTPLGFACQLLDTLANLPSNKRNIDAKKILAGALLTAGGRWQGLDRGDTLSAKMVREHPAWRKDMLAQTADLGGSETHRGESRKMKL